MKEIIAILFFAIIISSKNVYAGFYGLTHHSRANCVNNESISWHAGYSYWLWVSSQHTHENGESHYLTTGWVNTWRAAAVHWGEGRGGWVVNGEHWMRDDEYTDPHIVASERVTNCSIYDGWWD